MATVAVEWITHGHDGAADLYRWVLTGSDDGAWLPLAIKADKSVHLFGTFGNAVVIEGTNEPGTPANAVTLTDPAGDALSFTAAGLKNVLQPALKIRPRAVAAITSVTIYLLAVRAG